MDEARREREVADSAEAQAFINEIHKAVVAYLRFLERNGLIWGFGTHPSDDDWPRLKAQALIITFDFGRDEFDISLKDGALDRVYGNGVNPDPEGRGPPDIPHKRRRDE
jgi:hypothetical protein